MDIFEIRRLNLAALVSRLGGNGRKQKEIAADLDLGASHLSQLMAGKRIGEDVARKIEVARSLPLGWMDQIQVAEHGLHVAEDRADYGRPNALRIDPETIAAALKLVRLTFQNLKLQIDQESNGEPLAYAYEFLLKRREQVVTAENVIDFIDWIGRTLTGEDSDAAQPRQYRSVSGGNSRSS